MVEQYGSALYFLERGFTGGISGRIAKMARGVAYASGLLLSAYSLVVFTHSACDNANSRGLNLTKDFHLELHVESNEMYPFQKQISAFVC
jgi:hypothetical protein